MVGLKPGNSTLAHTTQLTPHGPQPARLMENRPMEDHNLSLGNNDDKAHADAEVLYDVI